MRASCVNIVAVITSLLLLMTVAAAPVEPDDEQSENALVAHGDEARRNEVDDDRMSRREWGLGALDGRLPSFRRQRKWPPGNKRKKVTKLPYVRCIFNVITCFP